MSYWVAGYQGAANVFLKPAVSRSHAGWVASRLRRDPLLGRVVSTIQIRPAAGAPVECWAHSRASWRRV